MPATPSDGDLGRRAYDGGPSIRKLESAVRAASKQSADAKRLGEQTSTDVAVLLAHVQALRNLTETNLRALVSQGDETNRTLHSIDERQGVANGRLATHDAIIVAITKDIAAVKADIEAGRSLAREAKARRDGMLVVPRVAIGAVKTVGPAKVTGLILLGGATLFAGTQLGGAIEAVRSVLAHLLGG